MNESFPTPVLLVSQSKSKLPFTLTVLDLTTIEVPKKKEKEERGGDGNHQQHCCIKKHL